MESREEKARFGNRELGAVEIQIAESVERWTEITLEDGSVIRIKPVILKVLRAIDEYDQEGNPMYSVKVNQAFTVSSPTHLREGGSTDVH